MRKRSDKLIKLRRKVYVLTILTFTLLLVLVSSNKFQSTPEVSDESQLEKELPKPQDLTSDNSYEGVGAAWNVTHWANRTDSDVSINFDNNTYDTHSIPIGAEWEGYNLSATIDNLYDTRNWVNGTFHQGEDDGDSSSDSTDIVYNWTFGSYDSPGKSAFFSGNYYDGKNGDPISNEDYVELRITKDDFYQQGDKCWWNTSVNIPRGTVIDSTLSMKVNPYFVDDYGNLISFQCYINDVLVYGLGLYSLRTIAGGANWIDLTIPLVDFLDDPTVFSNPLEGTTMNITLQLNIEGNIDVQVSNAMDSYYQMFFDNVTFFAKSQVKPEQIGLKMNGTSVNDIDWGMGKVNVTGSWYDTEDREISAKFNATIPWPLGTYDVNFTTDLNMFARKDSPETNYETNTELLGTDFSVANNSAVDWSCYVYVTPPSDYEETKMKIEFPTDVNITWISSAQQPSLNKLDSGECDNSTAGVLYVDVSDISLTPSGFWKLAAMSPNYCRNLTIYSNATGTWKEDYEFYSGDYVNITTQINKSSVISDYIQYTKAQLTIKFPNGSTWDSETQLKSPNTNGLVNFDPIKIPTNTPNYEVGSHQAIISWNNSHNGFGFNETGVIYKEFTIIHNSSLTLDQDYYSGLYEGDEINIRASFLDVDGRGIEDALVYIENFTGGKEYFDEINPGYYVLIDFNTTGALEGGENNLTIYANSTLYRNNKVNVTLEIIVKSQLEADEYPRLKVPWNNNFTIHLNYSRQSTGTGIVMSSDPTVYGNDDYSIESANGLYNVTCNSSRYQVNLDHNVIFEFDESGYQKQSLTMIIEVVPRNTSISDILINSSDCTVNKSYQVKAGNLLNLTVKFNDEDLSGSPFVENATVTLNNTAKSIGEVFSEDKANNFYNLTLNSTKIGVGFTIFNLIAKKDNFTARTISLSINIFERGSYVNLYLNGTDHTADKYYQLHDNELLNITVAYNDSITKEYIPEATVDINGSQVSKILKFAYNNYSVEINSTKLNQGGNFLTIFARKNDYEAQSILLILDIIQIQTNISFYSNDTYQPPADVIELDPLIIGNYYNFTTYFQEHEGGVPIVGADVNITGLNYNEEFDDLGNGNYSFLLDSEDDNLKWGTNYLTIIAEKPKYEPQTFTLKVEIVIETTNYTVEVDGEDKTSVSAQGQTIEISKLWNENVDLNFIYRDENRDFIPDANISIEGTGFSKNFTQENSPDRYNLTINTTDLGVGVIFLTLTAEQTNYEVQTIIFKVEVANRNSYLELYINGVDETVDRSFTINWSESIGIVVYYNDTTPNSIIEGADVDINGSGLSYVFNPQVDRYEFSFNSMELGVGTHYLTIEAEKTNYTSQTIVLKVQVVIRDTTFKTYINGIDKTVVQSYKTSYNELITITVVYNDTDLNEFISDAIVSINGTTISSLIEPSGNVFQITMNSATLGTGISFLTIEASKTNYKTHSLVVSIDVIERTTDFYLEINQLNKTLDKSIEVPIRSLINITVNYFDENTGSFISGAAVSLIGENISLVLTENATLGQYSILVNSTDLDIGVRFLTVTAQKANFESYSARLRIQVNRIRTRINIESGNETINTLPGESVTIGVSLQDLDYGGNIENATVTYSADFGQGELSDPDGDGVFEAVLTNIPEGTYQITVSVYADDDYDFERIRLTLNAFRPPENVLLFQVLTILAIGAAIVVGGYFVAYQRVLKYPKPIRRLRKFRKSIKSKKLPSIQIPSREDTLNKLYKEKLNRRAVFLKEKAKEAIPEKDLKPKEPADSVDSIENQEITEKDIEKEDITLDKEDT